MFPARTIWRYGLVIAIVALTSPGFGQTHSSGEPTPPPALATHREEPDMPRQIIRIGDRLVSPPLPPAALRVGPFQSVQVNVDAQGNNIIGDAANEPSMAIDPQNPLRIAVGWRQFDAITSNFRQAGYGYSRDAGRTWTFPGSLTPGFFRSDPVLAVNSAGTMFYSSLRENFHCDTFISTDAGQTWSTPFYAFGGDKQWITVDRTGGPSDGNIYVAWSRNAACCGDAIFTRSFDGGQTYTPPVVIPSLPQFGTLCVGADGAVYVAGRTPFSASTIVVARSTDAKDPNVAIPTFTEVTAAMGGSVRLSSGPNPVGLLGQVWIRADLSGGPTHGNLYLLASLDPPGGDPLDVRFCRSTDGGQTWSTSIRVNNNPVNSWQWFGAISVAPNGRLDVTWYDTRNDSAPNSPSFSEVFYRSSSNAGVSWGAEQIISPPFNHFLGYPMQNKLGDYSDMTSDLTGASLIYAATFNGEQDVYFVRIGPEDCNGNGVPDLTDISGGASLDCNANGIPDECEPDCNDNGVPDDCDIAGSTSTDCDKNGVPDDCEPDCNNNGVTDACDIASGASQDCNGNGIPDECDIAAGTSLDCNGNGAPDSCDIATGFSADCDVNGIPDECDPDCNQNDVPDACDILGGIEQDCNNNGIPDSCEIADGDVPDCNGNGVPDACDVFLSVSRESLNLSPIGAESPQSFVLFAPPSALGDVLLTFVARADLNFSTEYLSISINGVPVGNVFETGFSDCAHPPNVDSLQIPASAFNLLAAGENATITVAASLAVDAALCSPPSFVRVLVAYDAVAMSDDLNKNGVPDECESTVGDMNCDGIVTPGDIAAFVLALTDPAQYAAAFPNCNLLNGDVNGDGLVTPGDIAGFVALLTR